MTTYEIVERALCFYSLFLLYWSMSNIYQPKIPKKGFFLAGACFWILGSIALILCRDFIPSYLNAIGAPWRTNIYLLFYGLVGFTFSLFLLKGWWLYKLTFVCIFVASHIQTHPVCTALSMLLYGEQNTVFFALFNHLLITLCALFYSKYALNSHKRIPGYFCLSSIAVSVLSVYCITSLMVIEAIATSIRLGIMLSACFLGVSLILVYHTHRVMTDYENRAAKLQIIQREKLCEIQMQEATNLYQVVRKTKHEFDNHLMVMDSLIQTCQFAELHAYFSTLIEQSTIAYNSISTGNRIIDTLIGRKLLEAERYHIPFDVDAALPDNLSLEYADICAVLFNLIDNALEASRGANSPHIRLTICKYKKYVSIVVKNTVDKDVLVENPNLSTTKAAPDEHGLGIPLVREIIVKYDGDLQFSVNKGWFTANALMKDIAVTD